MFKWLKRKILELKVSFEESANRHDFYEGFNQTIKDYFEDDYSYNYLYVKYNSTLFFNNNDYYAKGVRAGLVVIMQYEKLANPLNLRSPSFFYDDMTHKDFVVHLKNTSTKE